MVFVLLTEKQLSNEINVYCTQTLIFKRIACCAFTKLAKNYLFIL